MELNVIVKQYLESIGGIQCQVCNNYDHESRITDSLCEDCNKEVEDVMSEADDW